MGKLFIGMALIALIFFAGKKVSTIIKRERGLSRARERLDNITVEHEVLDVEEVVLEKETELNARKQKLNSKGE